MEYILSIYVIYKEEDSICKKVLGKNKVLKVSYKFRSTLCHDYMSSAIYNIHKSSCKEESFRIQ